MIPPSLQGTWWWSSIRWIFASLSIFILFPLVIPQWDKGPQPTFAKSSYMLLCYPWQFHQRYAPIMYLFLYFSSLYVFRSPYICFALCVPGKWLSMPLAGFIMVCPIRFLVFSSRLDSCGRVESFRLLSVSDFVVSFQSYFFFTYVAVRKYF